MNCCEDVLVTLRFSPQSNSLDLALPAFLCIKELVPRLLETLSEMDPLHFGALLGMQLYKNGHRLEDDTTLAEAGVWDGSVLDAVCAGGESR